MVVAAAAMVMAMHSGSGSAVSAQRLLLWERVSTWKCHVDAKISRQIISATCKNWVELKRSVCIVDTASIWDYSMRSSSSDGWACMLVSKYLVCCEYSMIGGGDSAAFAVELKWRWVVVDDHNVITSKLVGMNIEFRHSELVVAKQSIAQL